METTFNLLSYIKLKLKIDFPDLSDTWLDGYESANKNLSEENNPFPSSSPEFQHWEAGWWAGFFGEPALFDFSNIPVISNADEVIHRIEQTRKASLLYDDEASTSNNAAESFLRGISVQTRTVFTYLIQCMAAIMAFSVCYQFADFFA